MHLSPRPLCRIRSLELLHFLPGFFQGCSEHGVSRHGDLHPADDRCPRESRAPDAETSLQSSTRAAGGIARFIVSRVTICSQTSYSAAAAESRSTSPFQLQKKFRGGVGFLLRRGRAQQVDQLQRRKGEHIGLQSLHVGHIQFVSRLGLLQHLSDALEAIRRGPAIAHLVGISIGNHLVIRGGDESLAAD